MEQKIARKFVERTEEEKNEKAKNLGTALFLLVLSIFGVVYIIEFLRDYFSFGTITEAQNSLILLGFLMIAAIFILVVYWIGYIISYCSDRYKEIELKNEQKETKLTRRKK